MAIKTFTTGEVLTAADTNTYLANSGLVYVKQQAFSGSATAQVTSCFSSTYDNYRLVFGCTSAPAGGAVVKVNMLSGTTPNATTNSYKYYEAGNSWAGTADVQGSGGNTYWFGIRSDSYFFGTMEIQNPFNSVYTTFQSDGIDSAQSWQARGQQLLNNSYDGIQFVNEAGNMSGLTVFVYGYRKS